MSEPRSAREELLKGIWRENPVFIAALGLCPALAVTNSLFNGLVMGAASTVVLLGASLLVSTFRNIIPKPVRISVYIIIIAVFVTMVDFVLAALMPDAHKQLGAFISLIVANCLILGRQEAFASKNRPGLALADGLGMALGFTLTLAIIGGLREILGNGTLGGVALFGEHFEPWVIMMLPPGGFLTLGLLLVVFAWVRERRTRRNAAAAGSQTGLPGRGP
jgi:Na+-translocating ferredoxin:NAD+ oxidoreductase subunit E